MDINLKMSAEQKWVTYNEGSSTVKFLIKTFPRSLLKTFDVFDAALKLWNYSICDWKGLNNEATGESLPCNSINKLFVFDHYQEFVAFVIGEVSKMEKELKKKKPLNCKKINKKVIEFPIKEDK